MRILIIEQEKTIRDSLSCFMEQQGNLDVSSAPSWRDGMSLIQTVRFDIVFCGHRLPDGNGLEMLKELARQNPKLISILMTEHFVEAGGAEGGDSRLSGKTIRLNTTRRDNGYRPYR
jgi:DNA-binding NtrC family response regulator